MREFSGFSCHTHRGTWPVELNERVFRFICTHQSLSSSLPGEPILRRRAASMATNPEPATVGPPPPRPPAPAPAPPRPDAASRCARASDARCRRWATGRRPAHIDTNARTWSSACSGDTVSEVENRSDSARVWVWKGIVQHTSKQAREDGSQARHETHNPRAPHRQCLERPIELHEFRLDLGRTELFNAAHELGSLVAAIFGRGTGLCHCLLASLAKSIGLGA